MTQATLFPFETGLPLFSIPDAPAPEQPFRTARETGNKTMYIDPKPHKHFTVAPTTYIDTDEVPYQLSPDQVAAYARTCVTSIVTIANGDRATGQCEYEDGVMWWNVVDKNGNEYQTKEAPKLRL